MAFEVVQSDVVKAANLYMSPFSMHTGVVQCISSCVAAACVVPGEHAVSPANRITTCTTTEWWHPWVNL